MNRTLRFAGLVLACLTISTVAMAQQGGGGGGGGGGGSGGGDPSVLELLRQDANNPRLSRAVQTRPGNRNCLSHVCEQQPPAHQPRGQIAQFDASCSGGEVLVLRRADGRAIRYVCRNL